MEVRFEAAEPGRDEDLRSLHHWLSDDRSLRGHARIEAVTSRSPGRMGPGLETVCVLLSTAAALAQLPLSYLAWRQGRRPQTPVTVNVVAASPAEAEAMLRRLGVAPPAGGRREEEQRPGTGADGPPGDADGPAGGADGPAGGAR